MKTVSGQNQILEGVIWKQLLLFFGPIWMGTFFQQLYSTVDAIILGNFVGTEALAAVGATGTFINLFVGFFTGLASGATVLIAQYYGAGQEKRVSRSVHTAFALALAGGVVITVLGLAASRWALTVMNTPADILDQAVRYIRVYFLGTLPTLVYNMGAGILRALGDSKHPLYFLLVASGVNIGLDLVFVALMHWGVEGAALATDLSQVASCVLVLVVLGRAEGTAWQLRLRQIRFDGQIMGGLLRIGLPAGFQSVLYCVSNLVIQASINSFGTDTVAAWTVYGKLDAFFWMTVSSMGLAVTTFVGQNYGAGKYDRVKKCTWSSLGVTAIMTVVLCVIMLAFSRPLCWIFTDSAAVTDICVNMMRFLVPSYLTYVSIEIFSGLLRGVGDALTSAVMTCVGVCGLRLLWIFVAVPWRPTMYMVMASYPITWVITSLAYLIYYFRGSWLKKGQRYRERQLQ